jgi:hypothetical protein
MSTGYFASEESNKIGSRLIEIARQYFQYVTMSGTYSRMMASHYNYYGRSANGSVSSHDITPGGKAKNIKMLKVNHIRNMGQHLLQLTTSQKPSPQPVSTNSDAQSQKEVTIAKGILEYYEREKRVAQVLRRAAECAIVYSEGFIKSEWDTSLGDISGTQEDGSPQTTGDVNVKMILPTDVIRDSSAASFDESDWVIVRNWENKYNVAYGFGYTGQDEDAQNDIVQEILGQPAKNSYGSDKLHQIGAVNMVSRDTVVDTIAVYELFHKKTRSLPNGRYVRFLESGTVLSDSELQYKQIPVRCISPGGIHGTPFGYTPIFDLLALQRAIDALYSAVLTNQLTFGVQAIMAMKGADLDFRALSEGLALLEYSSPDFKPESVNFTQTAPEIFKFIEQLEGVMETISGVNSVVRGNPEASLKSGSALALVQSQAISFSSGLQESYAHLIEDVYTDILNIIQVYAHDEKVITLIGRFNRSMSMSYDKASIQSINRVVVNSGSALSQSLAGRVEVARDMLQNGLVKRPEEYLSVLMTGRLDPMLEGDNAEMIQIRSENEDMADGKPVSAVPTDEHVMHIKEHRAVLATPEARNDPDRLKIISDHMTEHVRYLADPMLAPLLSVLGQTPLQMAMAPAPGQGYAGGPDSGQPQPPPGQEPPKDFPAMQGPMPTPNMPINPETGLRWDPQTGGGAVIPDSAAGSSVKPGGKMPLPGDGVFQAS